MDTKINQEICKHKRTNKLFYLNVSKGKRAWKRTDYSICLECGAVLKMEKISDEQRNI